MSSFSRHIKKNAENFIIEQMYANMTPAQFKQGIEIAVAQTKKDLTERYNAEIMRMANSYNEKLKKMEDDYNKEIYGYGGIVFDTISVELLYELANQMGYWDLKDETEDDRFIKESAKYRIKEIYHNTIQAIETYHNITAKKKCQKKFKDRKRLIEKEFELKFD